MTPLIAYEAICGHLGRIYSAGKRRIVFCNLIDNPHKVEYLSTVPCKRAYSNRQKTVIMKTPIHRYVSSTPSWIRAGLLSAFLSLFFFLTVMPARAGLQDDPTRTIGKIRQAIESGDAESIVRHSSAYVEVSVLGKSTLISRAQSAYVLKAFFRDHPPSGFKLERRLQVGGDWYVRGRYGRRNGEAPFQIELQMRWNGDRYEIKNILINYLDR